MSSNKRPAPKQSKKTANKKASAPTKRTLVLTGNRNTAHWDTSKDCEELETLQKHVGGNIEGLAYEEGWQCYVNEEGLLKHLPQNESCAYMLNHLHDDYGNVLVWGPAVFVFEGAGSATAMKNADQWFQKYKNDNDFVGIIEEN